MTRTRAVVGKKRSKDRKRRLTQATSGVVADMGMLRSDSTQSHTQEWQELLTGRLSLRLGKAASIVPWKLETLRESWCELLNRPAEAFRAVNPM